ncbi:hypothetical protein GCM10009555_078580 [Acrocarpospora macrocephala]|uniref:Uncharacterized protein n=1 Tax=Acrocarpospora macrocephala TaxID=150177 RepID=A0A5M3X7V3_9ACTN|nr:hypothetical protein Amac_098570 [Acrocarpospora macrocephala]
MKAIAAQVTQAEFAAKSPEGKVREQTADQVGEDLLDDSVVTVLLFGLDQVERAIGEHRVTPVDAEQLLLPATGFGVVRGD